MSTVVQTDATPPMTTNRSRLAVVAGSIAFVVVGTLAQLPRQAGLHMWRTVWAEDGSVFYAEALARPWRQNVLESYAGYAHVVPRTLASIGVHLPPQWYSSYVTLAAAFAATLMALFVYFASAPLLRSRVRQAILALALLLWPVLPFEITGSITNIQWTMPVACLLAVLLPVERPLAIAVRLPIVMLAPLSSPLCVLFVPIALWQAVRVFTRKAAPVRLVIPIVYGMASAVQLLVFATAPQAGPDKPPLGDALPEIGRLYSTKVSTEFFFGVRVTQHAWDAYGYRIAIASVVAILGLIVWRLWRAGATSRVVIASLAGASAVIYFASIWQRSGTIGDMMVRQEATFNFGAMRYELFPSALLLIAMLVPLDLQRGAIADPELPPRRPLRQELRDQRFAIGVAAVWMLVAFVPSYRLTNARSGGPDWLDGIDRAEHVCQAAPTDSTVVAVPISPQPVWSVPLRCGDL